LLPFDARHGLRDDDARKRRGSRASSVGELLAVEEKSSGGLGEESERKSERRERYERLGGEGK
jgi:hypothetical protein